METGACMHGFIAAVSRGGTDSVESAGFDYQKDCHNEMKTVQGVYCKHKEGCI